MAEVPGTSEVALKTFPISDRLSPNTISVLNGPAKTSCAMTSRARLTRPARRHTACARLVTGQHAVRTSPPLGLLCISTPCKVEVLGGTELRAACLPKTACGWGDRPSQLSGLGRARDMPERISGCACSWLCVVWGAPTGAMYDARTTARTRRCEARSVDYSAEPLRLRATLILKYRQGEVTDRAAR